MDEEWLNDSKTEFLIIGTERELSKVSEFKVGQTEVAPASPVRNLDTWFDSHVTKVCGSAFYYLYMSGISGSICPVNLLKGLSMRSLLIYRFSKG